jgi:hypothetical protein
MENNIIMWAKRFASAGYHVFPLYASSNGLQKPFGWARNKNPQHDGKPVDPTKVLPATTSLEEIDSWVEKINTGYRSSLGGYGVMGIDCVIVDLDVKKGKDGYKEFKELASKFSIPEPSIVVKSKSGGYHLYFSKSKKYKRSEVKTLAGLTLLGTKYAGIDIRGDGGMVIGPQSEGPSSTWEEGLYQLIKGSPGDELSELPDTVVKSLVKVMITAMHNDLEAMVEAHDSKDDDVIATLRRGEIPTVLPDGQRNEGFYAFINALKAKNVPKESAKVLCEKLAQSCEDPSTLHLSVNIDEMLQRVYTNTFENPYDVARDLLNRGMTQLCEQRNKLSYVILNENPYIQSTGIHDEVSMRTLLVRFSKMVEQPSGKPKLINPMDVVINSMLDDNRADILGFKPGAGDLFRITSDAKSKRILNLYEKPFIPVSTSGLDDTIYDEFMFIVSRIFGDFGSQEFKLGMDFSAWFLQNPNLKPAICPYVMSRNRGVGKSLYISALSAIAGVNKQGDKQCRLVKLDEVGGRFFNPAGFTLLMFDEVQFPVHRDMRKESTTFWRHMKDLVTSTSSSIEIKGGGTFQLPNLSGMLMAGNSGSHFPIEEYDRRIWVIDNNPVELARGLADKMFEMTRETAELSKVRKYVETIRYHLSKHKITMPLDIMRAPMTDTKMEMYRDSLSDIEEWWHYHFEDTDNLMAKTPVVSKSAIMYLIATSDRLMNTKYREDPESTFRDMKRRGLIRPIRAKGNQTQSRNLNNVSIVTLNGELVENDKREVLYTSREHGIFDDQDNPMLIKLYHDNVDRIKNWKSHAIKPKASTTTALDLIH